MHNINSNYQLSEQDRADETYLAALLVKPLEKDAVRVPILLYHHIAEISPDKSPEEKSYYVSPDMFANQMAWLAENNYDVIPLARLVNYLKTGANRPPTRSVVITFDDGTIGQYESAFPILKGYGFPATFFAVTNWINEATNKQKSGYMTWQQLKEMVDNGMEVGSHTVSHQDLGPAADDVAMAELSNSKELLEKNLGKSMMSVAYPGGSYNDQSKFIAEQSGYLSALSVEKVIDHKKIDLYHLGRMHIDNDMTYFKARVQGKFFK